MDKCEHYTIRGDVAKHLEQLKSLLPYMDSRKCKRWDCQHCIREFMEQECPHEQLTTEAGLSVAAPSLEVVVVTNTKDSMRNRIDVDTPGAVMIDAIEVLICTELPNAEVAKNYSSEPKVFFDLNEAPTPETCDEALDINNTPATNPERDIAELLAVNKQQTKILKESEELSSQVPNNSTGDANISPSLVTTEEENSDYDLVPSGNKTLVNKRARKYLSVSHLSGDGEKERYDIVSSPGRQPKEIKSKNKKKMRLSRIVEQQGGTMISDTTQDAPGENMKSRTFDCNISLDKNYQLTGVRQSPRQTSSSKRKNQLHDQNGDSEATISDSTEDGLQNEARKISPLKKRRIFGGVSKSTRLSDRANYSQHVEPNTDQSQQVVPDADQSLQTEPDAVNSNIIPKSHASHEEDKNVPSSSKRKDILSTFGGSGNSRPIRNKTATRKAAIYESMLGSKLKNKNCKESRTALHKKSPETSSHVVDNKKLIINDTSTLTTAEDVPVPPAEDDKLKLSELLPEISMKKLLNRSVNLKRLNVDSPSASKQPIVNPIGENRILSPTRSKKKQRRKKKVITSEASGSNSKKKCDFEQSATVGKKLVPREETTVSQGMPSEEALQLLSMVASQCLQLSDSGLEDRIVPVTEEFHTRPTANVLELGYGGCIEVTNPSDYFLVESEGDRFKLGPENLPLRLHRMLPVQRAVPISSLKSRHQLLQQEDYQYQRMNLATGTQYEL